MTLLTNVFGEILIEVLDYSTNTLLVSVSSLHIFKEWFVVCTIHSSFDKGLEGLANVQKIRLLLIQSGSWLSESLKAAAALLPFSLDFIN